MCLYGVFSLAKSAGRTQEPAVRRLGLYEREVLNDFVFPFVGRNAAACEGAYQPPALFLAAAGVKAHRVLDINDTAFISSLGHMDGVISCAVIRNSPPTMCAPSADAASCSGTCIRGFAALSRVMTLFRAMMNGDRDCAVTLHEMDEHWDAGPVIARLPAELRHDLSFLENMMLLGVQSGTFLARQLMRAEHSEAIAAEKQGDSRYWGFPDAQTLAQAEQAGIELVDHDAVREQYLGLFVGDRFHPLAGQFCAGFDDFVRVHGHD